jgi:hypothetical protein
LVLAGAWLLAGCLVRDNAIEFETGQIGKEYVPRQLIASMQQVGYRQVEFKSFDTNDESTRELRLNAKSEMRFLRRGQPTYIAVVNFDMRTTRASVRLAEDGKEVLSDAGRAELELVRASLRETFGTSVVP